MAVFNPLEAIHVATVLEDCVDQLIILGRIMPVSFHERPNAVQVSNYSTFGFQLETAVKVRTQAT